MNKIFKPYLEESLENQKGITFFVNGNTIIGHVTKIIDDVAVEVKNQRSSKAIILLEKIDAVELSY